MSCLDLNGKLRFKDHKTFGGPDWIINTINKIGTPIITAGDKPEASALVRKINTAFNSRLFSPEREFKLDEERTAAKNIGIKNPHET